MSRLHGHRKRPANEEADDLRVERIAAQLEERYQEDIWIEWLSEQHMEDGSLPTMSLPRPAPPRSRRRLSRRGPMMRTPMLS